MRELRQVGHWPVPFWGHGGPSAVASLGRDGRSVVALVGPVGGFCWSWWPGGGGASPGRGGRAPGLAPSHLPRIIPATCDKYSCGEIRGGLVKVLPPEFYWRAPALEPWWCWLLGPSALRAVSGIEVLRCAATMCRWPAPPSATPKVVGSSPAGGTAPASAPVWAETFFMAGRHSAGAHSPPLRIGAKSSTLRQNSAVMMESSSAVQLT